MKYHKVLFINKHFYHHSRFSGYEQLAIRWPGPKKIIEVSSNKQFVGRSKLLNYGFKTILEFYGALSKGHAKWVAIKKDFDVVHILYGELDLPFPKLPSGKKLVATLHQPISHLSRNCNRIDRLKKQLSNVDLCITVSSKEAEFIQIVCKTPTMFVPHGVDTNFFSGKKAKSSKTILIVDGWYRDGEIAEKVVLELLHLDASCNIRIVGLRHQGLKISHPRIQVLPRISDEQLRNEYLECGVLFLPLSQATANNALLEGMACNAVIVAPKIPGVVDYLGTNDLLYEKNAMPNDIALHILKVLKQVGNSARFSQGNVRDIYSWNNIIDLMNNCYLGL